VPDFLVRPVDPGDPADIERAWAVARDNDRALVGESDETLDGTRAALIAPDVLEAVLGERDGVAEARLVVEVDRFGREVFLDIHAVGDARPAWFRLLLQRSLAQAAAQAADEPAPPTTADPFVVSPEVWQAVAAHLAEDSAYAEVLAEFGFRPVRRFWRMHRPVVATDAAGPAAPAGVRRRAARGPEDERLLHALTEESFAEHFGFAATPFDEWMAYLRAGAGVDPDRWWIAEADGIPVGVCLLDDSLAEFGDSHVRTLGVLRSARGRGVARWLLGCAIADAADRGRTGIALSVDGENSSGAVGLYESVGFVARRVIDVAVLPV
jgi:ribosomal protein S18 acetylase RimI-like enzyme